MNDKREKRNKGDRLWHAARWCCDVAFGRCCAYCGATIGLQPCAACASWVASIRRTAGVPVPKEGRALSHVGQAFAPFYYAHPVRRAIWGMKYGGMSVDASVYAWEMEQCLRAVQARAQGACANEAMREQDTVSVQAESVLLYDCVVPVPTTFWEHHNRDNVPKALAVALGKSLCLPVLCHALKKTRETKRQMTLTRQERLENVKGVYAVVRPQMVRGMRVLLVDDVVTTGSTLNECAAALRAAGAVDCDAICIASSELLLGLHCIVSRKSEEDIAPIAHRHVAFEHGQACDRLAAGRCYAQTKVNAQSQCKSHGNCALQRCEKCSTTKP